MRLCYKNCLWIIEQLAKNIDINIEKNLCKLVITIIIKFQLLYIKIGEINESN